MANMKYEKFISFNVVGGVLWAAGMTMLGYLLGNVIPESDVDKYLLPIVGAIVVISVLPALFQMIKGEKKEGFSLLFKAKILLSRLVGR